MKSVATPQFWRCFRALPENAREAARKAYTLFSQDPSHPGLSFERLRSDPDSWSVRVTRGYRAVGTKHGDTMIWCWIGSHEDFDRAFPG